MNNKNGEWYKKTTGYIWKFIRYIWKCMNGRKWYSLLLLLSSLYVWKYRFEINQLKELNAKNIIFILWIFLLAFPLFSEMEIFDELLLYAATTIGKPVPVTFLIACIVAMWLICNEIISILENIQDMGVNIPAFLQPLVKHIRSQVEERINIDEKDEKDSEDE